MFTTQIARTAAALVCAVLFSTTMIVGAVGPAQALGTTQIARTVA